MQQYLFAFQIFSYGPQIFGYTNFQPLIKHSPVFAWPNLIYYLVILPFLFDNIPCPSNIPNPQIFGDTTCRSNIPSTWQISRYLMVLPALQISPVLDQSSDIWWVRQWLSWPGRRHFLYWVHQFQYWHFEHFQEWWCWTHLFGHQCFYQRIITK